MNPRRIKDSYVGFSVRVVIQMWSLQKITGNRIFFFKQNQFEVNKYLLRLEIQGVIARLKIESTYKHDFERKCVHLNTNYFCAPLHY